MGGLGGNGLVVGDSEITLRRQYDKNSRLKWQEDDNANRTELDYDPLGRLKTRTFADSTVESFTLDANDNVKTRTDQNGTVVTYAYDTINRLTGRTVTTAGSGIAGVMAETYHYNATDSLTLATDEDSTVARTLDSLGRVIEETQNGRKVEARWDGVGNLTHLTYPGGREIERLHDANNRLQAVNDVLSGGGVSEIASYGYVGPHRKEFRKAGNLIEQTLLYDGARRVLETAYADVTAPQSPVTLERWTYEWDRASNKEAREEPLRGARHEFSYTSTYQMNGSFHYDQGVLLESVAYLLDNVGNRAQVTGGINPGSYSLLASDDLVNQYTATPGTTRQYDSNGNLTDRVGANDATMVYDFRNQMVSYDSSAGFVEADYDYDPLGRRFRKTVEDTSSGTTEVTEYIYFGTACLEERDSLGFVVAEYVYGVSGTERLAMSRGGQEYYYQTDDLGERDLDQRWGGIYRGKLRVHGLWRTTRRRDAGSSHFSNRQRVLFPGAPSGSRVRALLLPGALLRA